MKAMVLAFALATSLAGVAALAGDPAAAAKEVVARFAGQVDPKVELRLVKDDALDRYETKVSGGRLVVSANSPVALAHGFYAATKAQGRGMCGWAGNRFAPGKWTSAAEVKGSTPFAYRYYFNVVTYGYTMPYWTWERWSREIDYMVLHGINAPLALVAQEAISARVFRKIGLTDEEIQAYFVGPAHLPWMRMGNISGLDSPMPKEWHVDQLALQHKILARMRALGMKPICPGFAGFVPPGLKRIYPDLELVETKWCGGRFHNWMVMPDHPVFEKIGTLYIQEWEKEFGKNDLYLVDSFNEMETPFPPHGTEKRYSLMNTYGEKVYASIRNANPDAIWVMQGWMFGYQRGVWDDKTLAALMAKVPDDKMLLLDEAVDYNRHFWRNGYNWDRHHGYGNKPWVYGVIPNMGGKCGLTGVLDFYANGHLAALNSPNRGRLVGHGMAPEGIENNQVVYEIMSDAAWRETEADTDQLLREYSVARYGDCPPEITAFWNGMRKSVYGSFTDHPRYNWQMQPGGGGRGSINANAEFFAAVEQFAAAAPKLGKSRLYRADLIEYAAASVGARVADLIVASERAMREGDMDIAKDYETRVEKLMTAMDRLLASHPHFSMQRWIDFARSHGKGDEALADYYEKNARRIVTIWGPPVDDYAAKIWSGLIRDYYLPRRKLYLQGKFDPANRADVRKWERAWVEEKRGLSPDRPYRNPVDAAVRLIAEAKKMADVQPVTSGAKEVASWSKDLLSNTWKELSFPVAPADIRAHRALRLRYVRGTEQLEFESIKIEMDGKVVAESNLPGVAGDAQRNNVLSFDVTDPAVGNNSCTVRIRARANKNCDSWGVVELIRARK